MAWWRAEVGLRCVSEIFLRGTAYDQVNNGVLNRYLTVYNIGHRRGADVGGATMKLRFATILIYTLCLVTAAPAQQPPLA